ncbi:CLIP-associating protein 1-like isoform X2 [Liolophura sinensis]|uniref:CLIP-associating protein 1-like isoform X2 n=1 Tax=Liolophura sinensis TaxID=3198878 RepID=UPI0031596FF3
MAASVQTLDDFLPNIVTQDTRKRIQSHAELVPYLSDPRSGLDCEDIDLLVDGLVGWVNCSNYKISLNGMEVLCLLVDRMGENFQRHVPSVLPAVVDRLGDSKDQVREQAQILLLKLMMPASSPQYVFERMMNAFGHKLWHVREEAMICLQKTLNRYGAKSLKLSALVTAICKLLEDQNGQVRETAVNTLAEIYRHVGEKVRADLSKKSIPPQRMTQIFAKFEELRNSGSMLPTADLVQPSRSVSRGDDDVDFARPASSTRVATAKRVPSMNAGRRSAPLGGRIGQSSQGSGGVDEELFIKSFEDVPKVQLFSARDLQELMNKVKDTLQDTNVDWEKRIDNLKIVRSLVLQGAADYDDFYYLLRTMEPAFMMAVKDLRSQVVREACISISYLAQQLGNKFDHFAETILPSLINLIPNSAKVMASSGIVAFRFIIQYTHSSRLIPIITGNLNTKSNVIRRYCFEFINHILHTWPTHFLEKHIALLQDAIKRGISDADSDARAFARKAFWGFADHFRDQADALLNNLDPAKKKMLEGELSNSSSNNSLNSTDSSKLPKSKSGSRSRSASIDRANDVLDRGAPRRTAIPKTSSSKLADSDMDVEGDLYFASEVSKGSSLGRSNSAVDLAPGSAKKSRTFSSSPAAYMVAGSTHSLPRPKSSKTASTISSLVSPDRSRPRTKIGISQSQPSSRSGSPSSRLSYITHTTGRVDSVTPRSARKSGIPRSQGTSRETSPSRLTGTLGREKRTPRGTRSRLGLPRSQGASREASPSRLTGTWGRERRLSGGNTKLQPGRVPPHKAAVVAHRVLIPGQDVERAVADALIGPSSRNRRFESYDSDDAASDVSSLCSERSFSSYSRTSETSSDQDKYHYVPSPAKDMCEILANLTSGSYADRKEGLLALRHSLSTGTRFLTRAETKKVTEVFTRMFHDPHSKVLGLFLETLAVFVSVQRLELQDWLYVLLTRLLNKCGTDILPSVLAKANKALDAVRDSFPTDVQFNILTRFIIDQTQTPNLKAKIAMLNYLHGLVQCMSARDFTNTSDTRLAVSRIITWTAEPKSVEVRKAAQAVLIGMFNLNTPEFSMMLSLLPKTFQDSATKILHNHLRSASHESEVLSPHNVTSSSGRVRPPSRSSIGRRDEMETENMNPEDIYDSIRKTTADIQNLSFGSKLERYDDTKKKREFTSQDSGIQDLRNDSPDTNDARKPHYNPSQYQDENNMNGYNRSALAEAVFDMDNDMFNEAPWKSLLGLKPKNGLPDDQGEMIAEILTELSNHNERHEQRKSAMLSLIKHTREGTFELWDEHFKTILLILLETLGDNNGHVRALALRVLKEILRHQPTRFKDYAELTILRILEAHKDPVKEVVRSAEECAATLANSIPPDQSIRILNPIVQTESFPVNMAAIKMQTKVIEQLTAHELRNLLPDIVPGLLRGYDDQESCVRKACVFGLVAIHMIDSDGLKPYLSDLTGSKTKLLNLYIKRAQAQKDGAKMSSQDT